MTPGFEITFHIVVFLIMVGGVFSLLTVFIPGLVIIWIAALVYGIVIGFNWVGGVLFLFITLLMVLGTLSDNLFMGASARIGGASWWSIVVALLAGIAGSIFFPPIGGLIAAFGSFYLVELIRIKGDYEAALESTKKVLSGCGWAIVARIAIGLLMISWWVAWALYNYGLRASWF